MHPATTNRTDALVPLDPHASWWEQPVVILDFETTGVIPTVCEPVAVAVVRLEQGRETDAFYSLLRPSQPIPDACTAIHGITDGMVATAPELVDVAFELARVGRDAIPCGYNAIHFDRTILHRYITGTDCPLFDPSQQWIDPLIIIRAVDRHVRGKGRHKLATACARWGCPMDEADEHHALGDVRAVGRLLVRLVELGRLNPRTSLDLLTTYTMHRATAQHADFERFLRIKRAEEAQTQLALGDSNGDRDTEVGEASGGGG
jgi:DNA polymerase III epsilon subunit-like protein